MADVRKRFSPVQLRAALEEFTRRESGSADTLL
jgi:hypothetical protein